MLLLLLLILVGGIVYLIRLYNGLQKASEGVREAHANIVVSMKKRIDLANKLIDIAKSYGDHEKLTHIAVSQADSGGDAAVIAASSQAAGAVQTVLKLATQYPALRASETYNLLMSQLEKVEANLQERRETYNGIVRGYNERIGGIPANLIAPSLGFRKAPYFNVDDADSLDTLKDFASADGEALKALLSDAGRRVAATTREVSRRVVETSTEVGQKAVELGKEAATAAEAAAARRRAEREAEMGAVRLADQRAAEPRPAEHESPDPSPDRARPLPLPPASPTA